MSNNSKYQERKEEAEYSNAVSGRSRALHTPHLLLIFVIQIWTVQKQMLRNTIEHLAEKKL